MCLYIYNPGTAYSVTVWYNPWNLYTLFNQDNRFVTRWCLRNGFLRGETPCDHLAQRARHRDHVHPKEYFFRAVKADPARFFHVYHDVS